jgi:PKD repeat protein
MSDRTACLLIRRWKMITMMPAEARFFPISGNLKYYIMKLFSRLLFAGCLLGQVVYGQLEQKHWFLSYSAGFDFQPAPVYDNSAMVNGTFTNQAECNTAQSDPSGNLIFYTDGVNLWNGNHTLVNSTLGGDISSATGAISIPHPSVANRYYLFLVSANGAKYRLIDDLGGGSISVGALNTMPGGGSYSTGFTSGEGVTAIKSCNGYWVILKGYSSGQMKLLSFAVTASGITYNSDIPLALDGGGGYYTTIEASPNGNHLALGAFTGVNQCVMLDFDKQNGTFSNQKILGFQSYSFGNWPYGLQFSPDSHLLYVYDEGSGNIYQYDVNSSNPLATRFLVGYAGAAGRTTCQLGIDGKIYVGRNGHSQLAVIDFPNNRCTTSNPNACGLNVNGPSAAGTMVCALPNMLDAYSLVPYSGSIEYTVYGCLSTNFIPNVCASTYWWDFGDPMSGTSNTSAARSPWHTFSSSGTYTVTLYAGGQAYSVQVTVDQQQSIAGRDSLCVYGGYPAQAFYTTNQPAPGQTITWTASNGAIVGANNQQSVTVNWTALPGTLTVTTYDPVSNCTSQTQMNVYSNCPPPVDPPCPCQIAGDFDVKFYPELCMYEFTPNLNAPKECLDKLQFVWDFGDGTTGTGSNVQHVFPSSGSYKVCLKILDEDGKEICFQFCKTITVKCNPMPCDCHLSPVFDYSFDPKKCLMTFYGQHGGPACLTNVQYFWNFGDGTTGTGQTPSHTYTSPGAYTVCLTVVAFDGKKWCENVLCYTIEVECGGKPKSLTAAPAFSESVEIFPNPATDEVNVSFTLEGSSEVRFVLRGVDGRIVSERSASFEKGKQSYHLDIPETVANGILTLELQAGGKKSVHRIAIER